MPKWSTTDMPNQAGRKIIVTGANSGIGFYTALELGRAGASVVVACRDQIKGEEAVRKMQKEVSNGSFLLELLDLADLSSVQNFAQKFLDGNKCLDVLINNAGVMALPKREITVDGCEVQFATNHLGHFALTGLLLTALHQSKVPRVVSISSGAAFFANLDLHNLQSEQKYEPITAYAQTKLANLLFMEELGRRAPWITSVAAHPGGTITNLQKYAFKFITTMIGQHASQGALPSLRAAVDQTKSGTFYAPDGLFNLRGNPVEIALPKKALDKILAKKLWDASEALTAIKYDFAQNIAMR